MEITDFVASLPERVYYLTSNGRDMWCRRPYGFFFTTSEAAAQFAEEISTDIELQPIGVAARDLMSEEGIAALRKLEVHRVFIDPRHDPKTGEVFGTILRITPTQ
jgi:hypothetical protein